MCYHLYKQSQMKWRTKKYNPVETVPKFKRTIVVRGKIDTTRGTYIYMTTQFPVLIQTLQ